MPLCIKNKRTGKEEACGVVGDSLKCGSCNYPIQDDAKWVALDNPYYCLVHETCVQTFNFNGQARTEFSDGRKEMQRGRDKHMETLKTMIARPWWNKSAPQQYQHALQQVLLLHESLRAAGIIPESYHTTQNDPSDIDDNESQ